MNESDKTNETSKTTTDYFSDETKAKNTSTESEDAAQICSETKRFNLNLNQIPYRRILLICCTAAVLALVVVRWNDVVDALGELWSAMMPFIVGFAIAYLLNIIMKQWERIIFAKSQNKIAKKLRRPICVLLTVITAIVLVGAVVFLLVSELRTAFSALADGFDITLTTVQDFLSQNEATAGLMAGGVSGVQSLIDTAVEQAGGWGTIAGSVFRWGGSIGHGIVNAFLGFIFALYVLANKEKVNDAMHSIGRILLPQRAYTWSAHAFHIANETFSRFIGGQCIEACILGSLCALGSFILGFPYAGTVGLCVGITSVIPYIGAWIGGAVGALMIASVSIEQAIWFVVFLVILQQIEGHLIYPNVVGSSVGMPGIWTFFAVVAGGSLFGFIGVLLGVPVVSTIRTLVLEWKDEREKQLASAQ